MEMPKEQQEIYTDTPEGENRPHTKGGGKYPARPPKDSDGHYILTDAQKKRIISLLANDQKIKNDYGKYASAFSGETLEAIHLSANAGDKELMQLAVDITYEGYRRLIDKLITGRYHITDPNSIEDMRQEALITIWKNLPRFDPRVGTGIINVCMGSLSQAFIRTSVGFSDMGITKNRAFINTYKMMGDAREKLKAAGIENPTVPQLTATINASHKHPISEDTVKKTAEMFSFSQCDYDGAQHYVGDSRPGTDPVQAYMQKEEHEEFQTFYLAQTGIRRALMDALIAVYDEDEQEELAKRYKAENSKRGSAYEMQNWGGKVPYSRIIDRYVRDNPGAQRYTAGRELRSLLSELGYVCGRNREEDPGTVSFTGIVFDYDALHSESDAVGDALLEDPTAFFGD